MSNKTLTPKNVVEAVRNFIAWLQSMQSSSHRAGSEEYKRGFEAGAQAALDALDVELRAAVFPKEPTKKYIQRWAGLKPVPRKL